MHLVVAAGETRPLRTFPFCLLHAPQAHYALAAALSARIRIVVRADNQPHFLILLEAHSRVALYEFVFKSLDVKAGLGCLRVMSSELARRLWARHRCT